MNFLITPFRWLLGLLRGVSELFELLLLSFGARGRTVDDDRPSRPWWKTVLMLPVLIPYWLWRGILAVLSYPLVLSRLSAGGRKSFLLSLPAVLILVGTISTIVLSFVSIGTTRDRYRIQMSSALNSKEFVLAKALGSRLMEGDQKPLDATKLDFAIVLDQAGESERALKVIEELAPDEKPGYAPAHRLRALTIARSVGRTPEERLLVRLRWHLSNSGDEPNITTEQLWASYYMTVNQPGEAAKHFEVAARMDPKLYIPLADLYQKSGNAPGESRALRSADEVLSKRLRDDPLLREERLLLALVQSRMNNIEAAENTVMTGLRLHPDDQMKREASSFFVVRHDKIAQNDPEDLESQMKYIEKAVLLDINNIEIYNRMINLYQRANNSSEAVKIREILEMMISEGQSAGLAHFALSSIYLLERDTSKAEFHLNQSYKLNKNMPVVTNNLAWMLAHAKEPDLERAMDLAQSAVKYAPENVSFHDTLATILMKQGKLEEAVAEYERILSRLPDARAAHRNLAEMYKKLDQPGLAKLHEDKVKQK